MALKLLLVFVEYTEFNALLLLQAISYVDTQKSESIFFVCRLFFCGDIGIYHCGIGLAIKMFCSQ